MLQGRYFRRVVELKNQWDTHPQLPFSECLTEDRIGTVLRELGIVYRDRLYTPCVTLWLFLWQVLSADPSCRNAVARFLAFRSMCGLPPCSSATGAYCTARQRLPEELLARLTRLTGQELLQQAPAAWQLHGRPVKIVDGSTVSMPDTAENTAAFGKPANQRGCSGFPVARIVVLLCLTTGAALELAVGPCRGKRTGELSLFRGLQRALLPGDILLGDRLFCTYCDMARLAARGVDMVVRLHSHRAADFRRGRRLGRNDHLVVWRKPDHRPDWLTPAEFAALSDELQVREVQVRVAIPGFRVRSLVLVTTLLDHEQFSVADIAGLFRQRWHAELDLRSIKAELRMDVLRCLSPEMVRKELWMHLLAYNLVRSVMCAAAQEQAVSPREISFKGTLQITNSFSWYMVVSAGRTLMDHCDQLLSAVGQHRVGNRPDRYEPRKRKRAGKPYPKLKLPRAQERKLCV